MAQRIVLLGPRHGEVLVGLEINSPDAGALVDSGNYRVSLTKWAGILLDATVIERAKPWKDSDVRSVRGDWRALKIMMPTAKELHFSVPIPLGDAVGRT